MEIEEKGGDNSTQIDEFELDPALLAKPADRFINKHKIQQLQATREESSGQIGPAKTSTSESGSAHDDLDSLKLKEMIEDNLPTAEIYEKSLMHKDIVNMGSQ